MTLDIDLFWRDRNVLVTGATGLLGSWIAEQLLNNGANVVALVRDWVPQSRMVVDGTYQRVVTVRGDVRDQGFVERVLGEHEIDTILHLAAQTIVGIANRNPISTFETNVQGTWVVLEAARRSPKVGAIVVASSDKAYGAADQLPYTEKTPLRGEHPYDVSKSCADLIAASYAKTWGSPVAITRCGNFFGGGDLNWNRIVPGTIRSLIRGDSPVIRSDGSFVRDYIYVEDAVGFYLHLAKSLHNDKSFCGEAFNFSTGEPRSVANVVEAITIEMGSSLAPIILNEASNEIREQYLDSQKAMQHLGWSPSVGFSEGLSRTIRWYRKYMETRP